MPLELRSVRLREKEVIDEKYTCEGLDVSIPLNWTEPPKGTKSFALIADDPDAPSGTFVHWIVYDLPGDLRGMEEAVPTKKVLENGAKQGLNDFRKIGYGGPCPPRGKPHRYVFTLYALDRDAGLQAGATKQQLLRAMRGHVLEEAQLIGLYGR